MTHPHPQSQDSNGRSGKVGKKLMAQAMQAYVRFCYWTYQLVAIIEWIVHKCWRDVVKKKQSEWNPELEK